MKNTPTKLYISKQANNLKSSFLFMLVLILLFTDKATAQITFAVAPASPFATINTNLGRRMKSADFNKDGIQDVVVSSLTTLPPNNLAVVLGTYTGAMQAPTLYGVPTGTPTPLGALATADFDGDGDIDIATIGTNKNLYILKNAFPTITFGATPYLIPSPLTYNAGFTELEAVDYDQDGDIDLLTVARNTTNDVVFILYTNNGAGLFAGGIITYTTSAVTFNTEHQIRAGRFNGINVELLYVNSTNDIFKISGLLTTPSINSVYTDVSTSLKDMAIGDFNLDGNTDVAITVQATIGNDAFSILNGNGLGAFAVGFTTNTIPLNNMLVGEGVYNILARDLDNDGLLDVVVSTRNTNDIHIYKNTSFATTTNFSRSPSILFSTLTPKELSIGDFNSDGLQDMAVVFDGGDAASTYLNTPTLNPINPLPDVCADITSNNYLTSNKVFSQRRNNFTVEGWFKMTDLILATDQYVFYNGTFGIDGFGLYVRGSSGGNLFVLGRGGTVDFSFSVGATAIQDQWMHFALIKNPTTGAWSFFLDGKQTAFTANDNFFVPSGNGFLGTENGGGAGNMEGFLQEFRFWHSILDVKTIREYSHTQPSNSHPKYFSLNSYYPLHDNNAVVSDVAFMTNKNALYKKAAFKISPKWSADIAPVGDGGSGATVSVPNGIFTLNARNTQGFEADFDALSPDGDIVISRVYDTPTSNLGSAQNFFPTPTGAISRTVFSNIYWVVENYGTTTNFPAFLKEITFDIKDNQFNSVVSPLVSSFPVTAPSPAVNTQANAFEIYSRPATSNDASEWRRVGVCNAFGSVKARKPGSVISDFGRIQLVIGVDLTILPIHLMSFSGKRINNETNVIEWITTFEYKNQLFEIEKSFDAKEFFRIGTEKPTNKTTITSYSFTDKYATEAAYYRLKQYDEDGKVNYSKTIFINNTKESSFEEFSVYPNPATDEIKMKITGIDNNKSMQMQVFSTMGTEMLDISGNLAEIEQTLNQNLAKMPFGLYMIQLQTENKTMKTKFIKK